MVFRSGLGRIDGAGRGVFVGYVRFHREYLCRSGRESGSGTDAVDDIHRTGRVTTIDNSRRHSGERLCDGRSPGVGDT
ncbi:hypothetical protein GOAMR_34_00790 [Gordonia amarae NBRC 15530]|uniref:Uncharacterized protein n=1 Tax=Gordonia amarae NBRC 15530 TaxID=1075090 RepID=G7GP87_9ACTN|nr:hypothetical protein GOAMR_34_00790 [Gordonia amarae NBRC 15530]